jgi:hypothetical protein
MLKQGETAKNVQIVNTQTSCKFWELIGIVK